MKSRHFCLAALAALATLLLCPAAQAHKPSDSYLALSAAGEPLRGQWDIALRDLEFAIGLDADGNGEITWGELKSKRREIETYAYSRLSVHSDGKSCALTPADFMVDEHSDGAYAVLRFDAYCGARASAIEIAYSLFFDLDPTHRGLLRFERGGAVQTAVLSPERPRLAFKAGEISPLAQFLDYLREGVWHIWIGFDHILFILSLLLPSVFILTNRGWRAAERFRDTFWDVFKVVTSFTVAHSITLSLAALSVIALPSRLVESTIALSVVLAALNNLKPVVAERRWAVAFAFGLIHGFGFASVLSDLGLPQDTLLLALVGFNVGVEAGQLAIVAAFLPLAFFLRRGWFYRRVVFAGGSATIALVAAVWLVERAFDLKLWP
ncbi:MAG: HupE/UreJ family protein [Candidatus Parcubacteria bacterium]|nr:HupE/UreJ family protein [Burkholderiales bacterium]